MGGKSSVNWSSEILRLENSLRHLTQTQVELRGYLDESGDDRDVQEALEENKAVMYVRSRLLVSSLLLTFDPISSSQTERISMLKLALRQKGGSTSIDHYSTSTPVPENSAETDVAGSARPPEQRVDQQNGEATSNPMTQDRESTEDDDGVFL